MAPVLLLFMVMTFSKTLEKEWTKAGLSMITLQQCSHSPQDTGKLTGHKVKTLLHTRHNHNLPTYVAFVDLVKAFDTVDNTLMLQILKNYGAPPKLRSSRARMYQDLKVVIKIGKTKETMFQTVSVRQGDCMAPVLFFFMMMAFAE